MQQSMHLIQQPLEGRAVEVLVAAGLGAIAGAFITLFSNKITDKKKSKASDEVAD